ncbi:FeoB-associated Cys-rich membrane protein [Thomasclavelia sp.]|uniref:FeoB-associated Cys-rich membrane protein n=1 Tax=Thomasclavelia sp. TaxID=3025757 RepID=UPI0025F0AE64|nr:FeoB-associated Cys-rich membrane protein [Thomasclavelia sp.]
MTWLFENLGTIVVAGIILILVILAIRSIHKDKLDGKSSCGGDCGFCGANCHEKNNLVEQYHRDCGKC